eukprot:3766002-Rhodomonas_salina.2
MRGTELAYGTAPEKEAWMPAAGILPCLPTTSLCDLRYWQSVYCPISLCKPYAMSSTEIAHALLPLYACPTRCPVLR